VPAANLILALSPRYLAENPALVFALQQLYVLQVECLTISPVDVIALGALRMSMENVLEGKEHFFLEKLNKFTNMFVLFLFLQL